MIGTKTWGCLLAALLPCALASLSLAQDAGPPTPAEIPAGTPAESPDNPAVPPGGAAELAVRQSHVADKYARLEKLLFDLSAIEAAENPRRAALLKRAFQQSADSLTRKQLETITELLARREYRRAVDEQSATLKDLTALLELLLSEDRPERLKGEQERIREYIREVDRLIRLQGSVQGRTEGGVDPKRLADEQEKVADRAKELARKIQENEEQPAETPPGDERESPPGAEGEAKPEADKTKPPEPNAQKPSESPQDQQAQESDQPQPQEGETTPKPPAEQPAPPESETPPQPGEQPPGAEPSPPMPPMPGSQQQPLPGPSPDGPQEPTPGAEQQQQQQQQENPARKRIQAAEEKMREAQRKLEEAKRKESLEEQEKAKEELQKAKAELEEILRQLREEEVERTLALLESRFRKMLELELRVYEATKRLDRVPQAAREREFAIQANNLSNDQRKIALEADKTLLLLQEEGSSVAFPETVEQMRDEMNLVSDRLATLNVGLITQESEEEIITTLEELIASLQQAQQEMDERRQQQQAPPGEPEDPPLVDQLAELRMIRALQMRVNTRTQRYARLLSNLDDPVGQVTDGDLREALEQLSDREQKIREITRELILGKNQ